MEMFLQFGIRRVIVHEGGDTRMKQQSGFTLVELAVVVFLIGMIATMGISALKAQLASASISATKEKQDTIKDALIAYLGRNKRLPCSDSDVTAPDGIENRGATGTPTTPANTTLACDKNFGIVPYQTLGLPKSAALDGWENFFSYQVSNDTAPTANLDWTLTNSFHAGNNGVLTVKDRSSADITNIVVVVISHGKNGMGAYTSKGTRNALPDPTAQPDEYQNTQSTTPATPEYPLKTFYNREYTENPDTTRGGPFDDIVMALNPNDLLTPLMKDGSLKSPEAQWAEQIANINHAVIGAMFNSPYCAPPTSGQFATLLSDNGIPTVDPWGGNLSYVAGGFCRLNKDGTYKTTSCTSNCGTCTPPTSSFAAFSITTTTTSPSVTIRPQTLSSITASNPSLLDGCPSP